MDFFLYILTSAAIAMPAVMGYTMLFGRGKILHFGPIGVAMGASYGVFVTVNATGSFVLGLCVGLLLVMVLSLAFAWLSFRLTPDGLGIMSLAVYLAIFQVVLNWRSVTRGALGIVPIPRIPYAASTPMFAAVAVGVCILWIFFFFWLQRTPFWRQLTALGEQEWYAKAIGIHRVRVHVLAFVILGGCLLSDNFLHPQFLHLLYPTEYQFPAFIALLMMTVAGKPGSIRGAIIATLVLTFLKEYIRLLPLAPGVLGPLRLLFFGTILLVAVYIQRDQLFPKQRTV